MVTEHLCVVCYKEGSFEPIKSRRPELKVTDRGAEPPLRTGYTNLGKPAGPWDM